MKNHITQFCLSILCAWTIGSIIACMPAISDPRVMHVASSDGIAYAALEPGKIRINSIVSYAQSEDGGQTWSPTTDVPQDIFQKPQPSVLCDPNRASLCFRITQKSQVDESNDGGKTWRAGWQIPPGREDYMLGMTCKIFGCARTGDWGPYDLSFLDQKGANTLLVAMGEQGVLVRTADGNWQRYGVLRATPSPMQASNLLIAILRMFWETLLLFAISIFFALISVIVALVVLFFVRLSGASASGRRLWAMRPLLFLVIFDIVLGLALQGAVGLPLQIILSLVWLLSLGVGFVLTWKRLETLATQPNKSQLTGGVGVAFLIIPFGLLPLLIWALGLPVSYEVALGIAFIFGLGPMALALYFSVSTAVTATTANV